VGAHDGGSGRVGVDLSWVCPGSWVGVGIGVWRRIGFGTLGSGHDLSFGLVLDF
jgi:hypothetical protein